MLIIQYLFAYSQQVTEIPYSQFRTYLRENKIAEVAVSDNYVQGTFKQALPGGETVFVSTRVDPALVDELQQSGAVYTGRIESNLLGNILSWTLPILPFFGIWYVIDPANGCRCRRRSDADRQEPRKDLCRDRCEGQLR